MSELRPLILYAAVSMDGFLARSDGAVELQSTFVSYTKIQRLGSRSPKRIGMNKAQCKGPSGW